MHLHGLYRFTRFFGRFLAGDASREATGELSKSTSNNAPDAPSEHAGSVRKFVYLA